MSVLIIYWVLQITGENMVNRRLWDGNKSCTIAFCYASASVN